MPTLLELLDTHVFGGVAGNTAYALIKSVWTRLTSRSWETLFLDSFEKAVVEARPRLQKYAAQDGTVSLNRSALSDALHYNLSLSPESLSYSQLRSEEFTATLSKAMEASAVVEIGGNNLSSEDYASLIGNIARAAKNIFRQAILDNGQHFYRALLDEVAGNQEALREANNYLYTEFGAIIGKLESLGDTVQTGNSQILDRLAELEQWLTPSTIAQSISRPIPDNPPQRPLVYAVRSSLVQQFCGDLADSNWLAIVDSSGKGKTHLARSIFETFGATYKCWINLRGRSGEIAQQHLRMQLILWLIQLQPGEQFLETWLGRVCKLEKARKEPDKASK